MKKNYSRIDPLKPRTNYTKNHSQKEKKKKEKLKGQVKKKKPLKSGKRPQFPLQIKHRKLRGENDNDRPLRNVNPFNKNNKH